MAKRSRKRPYNQPHRPLNLTRFSGMRHTEVGPGNEDYHVQHITAATKEYRCPGCQRLIQIGNPHVVVWRTESIYGELANLENRRHWHPYCWQRRLHP